MNYDIAIIIPVYNNERYIKKCLESIIKNFNKNTYKIQIIIIDDGSTDETPNICSHYSKKYNNIIYKAQKNQGVSVARNHGITLANAKYIMFVDSDDYIYEDTIERCLSLIKDKEFLIGGYCTFNSNSIIKENKNTDFNGNVKSFADGIEKWIYPPYLLAPWGKIFKTEIIKKYNIEFLKGLNYGEDAIFVINYLEKIQTVISISEIIYKHRVDNLDSLSNGYKLEMMDCDFLVNKYLERFLKNNQNENYQKICNKRFVVNFSGNIRKLMLSKLPYSKKKRVFCEESEKYNALQTFSNATIESLSEKITYLVLKNKGWFFLLYLHKIKFFFIKLGGN